MAPILHHPSLQATLEGTTVTLNGNTVVHYRGIPYGAISKRFAKSTLIETFNGEKVDCTHFGPQCPQNHVDVGYLFRIPENLDQYLEVVEQDEFRCLNLNVSLPDSNTSPKDLPVLIWIHGGSQVVSFPPVAHKCSDTTPFVAQSIVMGKPTVVVTFNYRLNIFGFGDGTEKNLALKDQRLVIEWVLKHISGFGGDKKNITLGGESAGAVYAHAHLSTVSPICRGILQSGSLYLSPPQPVDRGVNLISRLSRNINTKLHVSLQEAPVDALLQQLRDENINSLWIQQEADLDGWEERVNHLGELLIGDVEYESVIWRNGIEDISAAEITSCFDVDVQYGTKLKLLYNISPTRSNATKLGALDFIDDFLIAFPAEEISRTRRLAGLKTYQYIVDQVNPWQASSRAHHCVDLLFLFGGYDLTDMQDAERLGLEVRSRWIRFVNGEDPWDGKERFAFGPHGKCNEIGDKEYAVRRRVRHFEILREMGSARLWPIFGKLAAGRVSLIN